MFALVVLGFVSCCSLFAEKNKLTCTVTSTASGHIYLYTSPTLQATYCTATKEFISRKPANKPGWVAYHLTDGQTAELDHKELAHVHSEQSTTKVT